MKNEVGKVNSLRERNLGEVSNMVTPEEAERSGIPIGSEVTVKVVPSQTRTSFFPDQVVVFGRGGEGVELVLLRQELSLESQLGTIVDKNSEMVQVTFQPHKVSSEMVDIAHVRIDFNAACETAIAILELAKKTGVEIDWDNVVSRLR